MRVQPRAPDHRAPSTRRAQLWSPRCRAGAVPAAPAAVQWRMVDCRNDHREAPTRPSVSPPLSNSRGCHLAPRESHA
jgi:hypothetical protein